MAITSAPISGATAARTPSVRLPSGAGPVRAAWRRHRARTANAAAVRDGFMDLVVIVSVLMFVAMVVGIGILALGSAVSWPN
ncbi:hypothetical protein BH10ACT8_BH10ACT8_05800 [soil metagenome]